VELDGDKIIRTSRAASPDLPHAGGSSFHARCFDRQQELEPDS
jgi:hypothetical protein